MSFREKFGKIKKKNVCTVGLPVFAISLNSCQKISSQKGIKEQLWEHENVFIQII